MQQDWTVAKWDISVVVFYRTKCNGNGSVSRPYLCQDA
jgi:hypothetical protein